MQRLLKILLSISLFLGLGSCRNKTIIKDDLRTKRSATTQQLAGDGGEVTINAPSDLSDLAGQLQIGDGSGLNNQAVSATMGIQGQVDAAGPPVNVQSSKSASPADYSRLSLEIPYIAASSLRLGGELYLVIAYAVQGEDGKTKVGMIPASGDNAYKIAGKRLRFNLRGFGNYQALRIPIEIKEEKTATNDLIPTKSKEQLSSTDCTKVLDDPYCIKVRAAQIDNMKDLAIDQESILSRENSFKLSWKLPAPIDGILAIKVMLASDQACSNDLKSADVELKDQTYQFSEIQNGSYFGCVFAKTRDAGLLAAKNNGIKIVVDTNTTNPGEPTAVSVPTASNSSFNISFKPGTELNPGSFNIKACTNSACSTGCVGATTTASSPGTIASGALTPGTFYYGCVQGTNLAGKSSGFAVSAGTVLYSPFAVTYNSNGSTGGSVPTDTGAYATGSTVTVFGNTGSLIKTGNSFLNWNTAANGSGTTYSAAQTFSINANITLYAQWAAPDVTNPTAPSAISVATYSNNTTVTVNYTSGTDANFSTHNVKACTANDCITGCLSTVQDIAAPVTVNALVNGSSYFICIQAVDLSANVSAYVPSSNSVTIDTIVPTPPSSLGFSGSFSTLTAQNLGFAVGTDANFSTHDTKLCTAADCATGCGTVTQSTTSPVALTAATGQTYYGCARTLDLAGNASAWAASVGTMTIDTTNPGAPTAITVPTYSNNSSVSATYSSGTDLNFATHNVKACLGSDCSTSCLSVSQDVASPVTIGSLVNGNAYYICLQSVDSAGNTSAYVPSGNSVTIDSTNPVAPSAVTVPAISATASVNVTFTVGTDLNFATHNVKACTAFDCTTGCLTTTQSATSPATVSSLINASVYYICVQTADLASNTSAFIPSATSVTINTGVPNPPAAIVFGSSFNNTTTAALSWTNGSDPSFDTHNLKACTDAACSVGCTSVTQDPASPGVIAGLTNGTTYYACVQSLNLASSVSAWVASAATTTIDTSPPNAPAAIAWTGAYSNSTAPLSWTNGTDANYSTHNLKACTDAGCSTACTSVTQDSGAPGSISGMSSGNTYYACMQSVDLAGNTSAYVASAGTTLIDTTNPTAPSGITVPTYNNATTVNVTYTAGTDTNFSTHYVNACTASDCITGCLGATTDVASPVTVSSLVNGTSYWICLKTIDLAGNLSAYVASGNSVAIDTTAPAAPSALGFSGTYQASTTLSLAFSVGTDTNFSTHDTKLCTASDCTTGCGSIVQSATSPVALTGSTGSTYYGCARTVDLATNTSAWVPSVGTMTIDATTPTVPSGITVATYNNATSVNVTYTAGTDANFATHNVKACTASNCSTGCLSVTQDVASPVTVGSLVTGTSYWICLQTVDQANNVSAYVASGNSVAIDTTSPAAPSTLSVPAYSNSTSVNTTFSVGTDANMSTHNFKACSANDCSTGCLSTMQTATSPATLTGLTSGTAYYACVQSVDLAGNVSSFSFTPATVTIDTTAPTNPSAVTVPASSSTSFNINFTGGTETNPAAFNIKACLNIGCNTGCVGSTTTTNSPGTISSGALTVGTSYYGCVQGADLASNTSAFVASASTVLYNNFSVTYNANGSTGGSVPTDATGYASGATVTVLGPGSLIRAGYTLLSWNTAANGSGTAYNFGTTFTIGANAILYAQWSVDCSSLAGGTYVMVPGNSIYGTNSFCAQKYAASDVGSVPTSQTGTTPWVNINQTNAIAKCIALGAGYHLLTNPEWMTIAANLANVASNWSTSTVGTGSLRRGHSDSNPNNACAANATDANAYVETDCTGTSSGTFVERRTSTLSNGAVVWDISGNVYNWINYINGTDKPTPATLAWYEYTAISGSTATPRSHLVPLNSTQSWWNDSWNSAQGIGQIYPGTNGSGGALLRGGSWGNGALDGAFGARLSENPPANNSQFGLRCAYTPNSFAVAYDGNTASTGSPPNDPTLYASGNTVNVPSNFGMLTKSGFSFAGWNTLANGTGINYAPGSTFAISTNTILYARWINCSGLAGGTWVAVPGDNIYGTQSFCVQKYAPSNVSSVPTSQSGTTPWVSISQSVALSTCASLGAGFHLITNPEWMSIAANLANVGINWSGSAVGSGFLRRGHSDLSPNSACAADANDANHYVQSTCTGSPSSGGFFWEGRTFTLSNDSIIWDFSGNVYSWVNYNNFADKPTPILAGWQEFTAMTGSTTTPKAHMVPINSAQAWWNNSWDASSQGIGRIWTDPNSSGGALVRGGYWGLSGSAGVFAMSLIYTSSNTDTPVGFRCTWVP